ncbi:MAG: pyridoxamine 5'-phosphate oxidase family protein [Bacteroidota bacterium]
MNTYPITKPEELNAVINACDVCYVSMVDQLHQPYVLPFNFAYDGEYLYLHSGSKGKKMDILAQNPKVCIAFSTAHELFHQHERVACSWGMKYKSVIVYGENHFIDDSHQKIDILNLMMKKYSGKDDYTYNDPAINNVTIFKITITNITGKQRGY